MDSARFKRVESLVDDLLALQPAERDSRIAALTAGDPELRAEIEALLAADARIESGSFLENHAQISQQRQEVGLQAVGDPGAMHEGRQLLHYRLVAHVADGGMGSVWKAIDTTLDRDVAIKVLADSFVWNPERVARFEREAKLLASLNHANIASIYGLHQTAGMHFLAMEFVEGEDLAERLARGPMAAEEVLEIAQQVISALESAHDGGVIHRDLKPANIRLTPDGQVKVLDFGLAKASGAALAPRSSGSAPSNPSLRTVDGMILGTAAYMSPEQARGKAVDTRTDIWSFGCVLWECLTGAKLFDGETISDSIGAILRSEPEWSSLPSHIPPGLRRVLRRCLSKDTDARWHHAADVRIGLEDARDELDSPALSGAAAIPSWKRVLPWALASFGLIAAGIMAVQQLSRPEMVDLRETYRFTVQLPTPSEPALPMELSPDGRYIAFVAADEDRPESIWIQSLADDQARVLEGTEGVIDEPLWSTDSRTLTYFTADTVERVGLDGAPPETLSRVPGGWRIGSLASTGVLLFEVVLNPEAEGWYVLRPEAQAPKKIDRPLPLESEQTTSWPAFMPDGKHFVFIQHIDGVKRAVLTHLDTGMSQPMFQTDTRVLVTRDGHYLFARKGALLAQAFDPSTYEPVGSPTQVAEGLFMVEPTGRAGFSVSDEGTVIYTRDLETAEMLWFDREGRELGQVLESDSFVTSRLSPDGKFVAATLSDRSTGTTDLWVYDVERGAANRLTNTTYSEYYPIWSPDGKEIVYSADAEGPPNLFVINANGGESRVLVPANRNSQYASDWSAEPNTVLFDWHDPETNDNVWSVDVAGGDPQLVEGTDFSEHEAVLSPDGKLLAYTSDATGTSEIYVRQAEGDGTRQRVSVDGGWQPLWDGSDRIVFSGAEQALFAVSIVRGRDGLQIGQPELLVRVLGATLVDYGLAPDGRILVKRRRGTDEQQVSVIVGWPRP